MSNKSSSKAKLVPHPQEALAPGFVTFNCLFIKESSKSISDPYKYFKLTSSIKAGGVSENCISSSSGLSATSNK